MTRVVVNGNAYSDDGSTSRDMLNGGYRQWLFPFVGDTLDAIKDVVDTSSESADAAAQSAREAAESASNAKDSEDSARESAESAEEAKVYESPTPPENPSPGRQWLNTATGRKYTWYNDGNSSQWVEVETSVMVALPGSSREVLNHAILSYDTLAEAEAAATTLPDGQKLKIESDEARGGLRTRYEVRDGVLLYLGLDVDADSVQAGIRTQAERNADAVSVMDIPGDTLRDKVSAMASAYGYVRFSRGLHFLETCTIDVPVFFDVGASIAPPAGSTVTIRNRITANAEWIFKGEGVILVNVVPGSDATQPDKTGEDARVLQAAWFGVFPSNAVIVYISDRLQRCMNALGAQGREGVVLLSQGSYHVDKGVTVPRGVQLKGMGTRRTVFDVTGDGYSVFSTSGAAVKFSDFQFEQPSGDLSVRTSPLITINHDTCELYDLWLWQGKTGILIEPSGTQCNIRNLSATWGASPGAGSSAVCCRASGLTFDGFKQMTSNVAPEAILRIEANATLGSINARNFHYASPSIAVLAAVTAGTLSRVNVNNILYSGLSGTSIPALVKTVTSGTGSINGLDVVMMNSGSTASALVVLEQGSSGSTSNVIIDDGVIFGSVGSGIELTRAAGTLSDVSIGNAMRISGRADPLKITGTVSNVHVPPTVLPGTNHAVCYGLTIPDDSVGVIKSLSGPMFTGTVILTGSSTAYGIFLARAASSPVVVPMAAAGSVIEYTPNVLTGTTGTDGRMTVGVGTDGTIYIENRLGSQQSIHVTVLRGA